MTSHFKKNQQRKQKHTVLNDTFCLQNSQTHKTFNTGKQSQKSQLVVKLIINTYSFIKSLHNEQQNTVQPYSNLCYRPLPFVKSLKYEPKRQACISQHEL